VINSHEDDTSDLKTLYAMQLAKPDA